MRVLVLTIMINLPLILDSAGLGPRRPQGRVYGGGRRGEGCELRRPLRRVGFNGRVELRRCLGLRGSSRDGIYGFTGIQAQQGCEDLVAD